MAMTMLSEGTKDTRRPIDEVVVANQFEADVRRVLEVFADTDRRLVTLASKTIAESLTRIFRPTGRSFVGGSTRTAIRSGSHVASTAR